MMLSSGDTLFPNNVIALIVARIPTYIDSDIQVFRRPLRASDAQQCVGVFPLTWVPDDQSIEIQSVEPTLQRYPIVIQGLIKDTDEDTGISVHSILAKRLRTMFYRDPALNAGLTGLSCVLDNSIERMQRRGTTQQRYLSNEVQGTFMFTSWLEAWIETETTTQ